MVVYYYYIFYIIFQELIFKMKLKKQWLIVILSGIIVAGGVGGFFWLNAKTQTFTKPEYVKEVIVQNENFNDILDEFLDLTISYIGTKEDNEKLETLANKCETFVDNLEKKLKPKVPKDSQEHFEKMMTIYRKYLEAVDMYKKAVPKPLSEERAQLMSEAQKKLTEAQSEMKNFN